METHPQLKVFAIRKQGFQGAREGADLSPEIRFTADLENGIGTGPYSGLEQSELTLGLSSVLELGGQREARLDVVASKLQALAIEQEAASLEILADVTRRFVVLVAANERVALRRSAVNLGNSFLQAVQKRSSAGRVADAEALRAKASLAQYRLDLSLAIHARDTAAKSLALITGAADDMEASGDLFEFGSAVSFQQLAQRIDESPVIRQFAVEQSTLQAEIALLQRNAGNRIDWNLGVRRFQETDDQALIAGFSLPLFSQSRNSGAETVAQASLDELSVSRDAQVLALKTALLNAHSQREQLIKTANSLSDQIIPNLIAALDDTKAAYQRGRYSYLELASAREDVLSARERLIAAATNALLLGIQIETLTGEPLLSR
jgi:cobalt-zinc-cadmium efflux system outer membrane protein